MELNPYARFLHGHDARAVLEANPELMHQALCALSAEEVETPIGPGKWSPREIVAHLADCEMVFSFRLRQTLADQHHTIQPFDQDTWASRYSHYKLPEAVALYRAARDWNVQLLSGLTEEDFARTVTHPERGTMTLMTIVETMAGHDLNHLQQVTRLAKV